MSRLHSALIAVMTHIISRLGADALGNAEVEPPALCPMFSCYTERTSMCSRMVQSLRWLARTCSSRQCCGPW